MEKESQSVLNTENSVPLLNSAYLQFVAGCFGLGVMHSDSTIYTQLCHYQVRRSQYLVYHGAISYGKSHLIFVVSSFLQPFVVFSSPVSL